MVAKHELTTQNARSASSGWTHVWDLHNLFEFGILALNTFALVMNELDFLGA